MNDFIINIDLKKLNENNLNINEYLTLVKIYRLSLMEEIPFYTIDEGFINSIKNKGFIEEKNDNLIVTKKGLELVSDKIELGISSDEEDITEVLSYFKEVTGKNRISTDSPSNRKFIKDRIKQGYKKEDLKKVIDLKYNEWKDSITMNKYIRIETLFNETKFQKYVSEIDSIQIDDSTNFKRI